MIVLNIERFLVALLYVLGFWAVFSRPVNKALYRRRVRRHLEKTIG